MQVQTSFFYRVITKTRKKIDRIIFVALFFKMQKNITRFFASLIDNHKHLAEA